MPTPIIIDCDPGHDDAIALMLALASDAVEVRAVTTVGGNQSLVKTTRNARQVLTVADRPDIAVAAGCDRPLIRDRRTAGEVHGETGLDGPDLPAPAAPPADRHAVDALVAEVERAEESVTLVPTGPLTNVAVALRLRPSLADNLEGIVLMGGSCGAGNVTPAAEFNVRVDPEAAAIVLNAPVPVTMVGLDVTQAGRLPIDRFEELRAMGNRVGPIVADLLDFYADFHRREYGWDAVPIHDALAVAHVIDDGILHTEEMHVAVETAGTHTTGETVCDRRGVTGEDANASVALDLDVEAFHDMLFEAIRSY